MRPSVGFIQFALGSFYADCPHKQLQNPNTQLLVSSIRRRMIVALIVNIVLLGSRIFSPLDYSVRCGDTIYRQAFHMQATWSSVSLNISFKRSPGHALTSSSCCLAGLPRDLSPIVVTIEKEMKDCGCLHLEQRHQTGYWPAIVAHSCGCLIFRWARRGLSTVRRPSKCCCICRRMLPTRIDTFNLNSALSI